MVSCREIVELPALKKMKIVGGCDGLDSIVRWVHFIDLPDVMPWVRGGELLFITGIGLNESESQLLDLVRGVAAKKLAGLVINVGPYISKIPESAIKLADSLKFPLFELPWEVKLVEVTHDVSTYIVMRELEAKSVNDLVENMLFHPTCDFPTLVRRATYYGYDLSKSHQIGVARASQLESILNDSRNEFALMKLKERFEGVVREGLNVYYKPTLSMSLVNSIIFLIPEKVSRSISKDTTLIIAQNIIEHCSEKMPGLGLNIGLGKCFTDLNYAKTSFDQARLALNFADFVREKNRVYSYDDLGVHKLLLELESKTLQTYYEETLGKLAIYDKEHSTELVSTLAVYFQQNGNSIQAAKQLFIHKNTLTYRIKKIEKIVGKNLSSMHDRVTLQMGLIIGKQLEIS